MLALVLGVAGRRSRDDDGRVAEARGTGTRTPLTTATTAPADPYAVPATIDVTYVQRVLDALDAIRAPVVAELLAIRSVSLPMARRLAAIYNPEEHDRQVQLMESQAGRDLSVFKDPPGVRRTIVKRLLSARPDCISMEVEFDSSAVLKNPAPPTPTYLALQPTEPSSDPANVNPTPYSIFSVDEDFRDPCVGR